MNCRQIEFYIDDYLSGNLSPGDRVRFEEHLGNCDVCRECVQGERLLAERLKGLAIPAPPDEYWGKLEEAIAGRVHKDEDEKRAESEFVPKQPWLTAARYLVPLAAVLVMLFISFALKTPTTDMKAETFSPRLIGNYPSAQIEFRPDTVMVPEMMNSLLLSSPGTAGIGLLNLERLSRMGWEGFK